MNVICNRLYGFINRFSIQIKRTLSIQPLHYEEPIRIYSPSDLITFMESPFASAMERSALNDPELRKLVDPPDNLLTSLQNRGFKHEQDFIQSLKLDDSLELINIEKSSAQQMIEQTKMAMEEGKDIITNGYLSHRPFAGISDILAKVQGNSLLGQYHYEVWDVKLSKQLKPYFVIQLCCYVEMLERYQGRRPEFLTVVTGNGEKRRLRVENYFAYYRSLKTQFLQFQTDLKSQTPHPSISNKYGRWSTLAQSIFEGEDHLSQVANLTRGQIKKLENVGIYTMTQLSSTSINHIPQMLDNVLTRVKKQAALQVASKGLNIPKYEVLPHDKGLKTGLCLLPPASDLDIFFDIEGYPGEDGGLEYLWGNAYVDYNGNISFKDFWAHTPVEEKQAFIDFVNWVHGRWKENKRMHIYHYASYEITALRKLMGIHGVLEDKVDELLRNHVFVDLYNIVRSGVMIGVPRYSLKHVEHVYRGKRNTDVTSGGDSIAMYELWRSESDGETWETSKILKSLRDYNIDDCNSTMELATWLRNEQAKNGIAYIDLRVEDDGKVDLVDEYDTLKLEEKLLVKAEKAKDPMERNFYETLAWSQDFHRRENKPTWWKMFDRMSWPEDEFYEDIHCLSGLVRTDKAPFLPSPKSRNKVREYQFDLNQPFNGNAKYYHVLNGDNLRVKCYSFDPERGRISLQSKEELSEPFNIIPDEYVNPSPIPTAIRMVSQMLLETETHKSAIMDYLKRSRPRIKDNLDGNIIKDEANFLEQVIDAVINLDHSYLCIQGPPGSGKTYTAKHIIGKLLKQGKKVGVASNSHKAINNLMSGVASLVKCQNLDADLVKVGGDEKHNLSGIVYSKSMKTFSPQTKPICLGGTVWAFSNETAKNHFDYLFIDEAGQVSVPNLIAISQSCKNIILMGDQMQLSQPIQGSHPGKSGQSILDYLLEERATIPNDIGIFLPVSYRMNPNICKLLSDQVYEGKLESASNTQQHVLRNLESYIIKQGSGICYIPVNHEGNYQGSDEEIHQIRRIAQHLLHTEYWPDPLNGEKRFITWDDILFVAPYNYQVNKLQKALGKGARVGSVDKFQGQEAPIVILSMCSSEAPESPQGINFLFSKNRLNVAISRAQALTIIVASPRLSFASGNNLKQMELINFYHKCINVV